MQGGIYMKEIIYYVLSIIVVFGFIGLIESAMLFEKKQENAMHVFSKETERKLWKY